MNFQKLHTIETPDEYLDRAFKAAKKTKKKLRGPRFSRRKQLAIAKHRNFCLSLMNSMKDILMQFPNVDDLPEFYQELVKVTIDYAILKKSFGAVAWVLKKETEMKSEYTSKLQRCTEGERIAVIRKQAMGRGASFVKQIQKELKFLENSRRIMKGFPSIKSSVFTAAIAGFPNVGKTTLLYRLTGSKPEIQSYAFTTKGVNVAYLDGKKIQLLDTPGTLNRFHKMNNIEKQAYLAIQKCAQMIIYIFDLTEQYPLSQQKKLLQNLKKEKKPIIYYLSKTDLLQASQVKEFKQDYPLLSVKRLKDALMKEAQTFYGKK